MSYTGMYTRSQKEIKMKMETIVDFYGKENRIIALTLALCRIVPYFEQQLSLHVLSKHVAPQKGWGFSCFLCIVLIKGSRKEKKRKEKKM